MVTIRFSFEKTGEPMGDSGKTLMQEIEEKIEFVKRIHDEWDKAHEGEE